MEIRIRAALIASALLMVSACGSGDPAPSFDGERGWLQWASARDEAAGGLRYFTPAQLSEQGSRFGMETLNAPAPATRRFVLARGSESELREPIFFQISKDPRLATRPPGENTSEVDIRGHRGQLQQANDHVTIVWQADGLSFQITGSVAAREDALAVARGSRMAPFEESAPSELPVGYRQVAASEQPYTRMSMAMGTDLVHGSEGTPEDSAQAHVAAIWLRDADPWAMMNLGGDFTMQGGSYRRTTLRGADAAEITFQLPDAPGYTGVMFTWMEYDDVLVSASLAGRNVTSAQVREFAEGVRQVTQDEWRDLYPHPSERFTSSGEPTPGP